MPDLKMMHYQTSEKITSGIFITFSGNCQKALTFYQSCFGGELHFETLDQELEGFVERPVINGSLVSDHITIHGSDLVHNEGRKIGNYLSIYLACKSVEDRKVIFRRLISGKWDRSARLDEDQKLVEVIDTFEVRWLLGLSFTSSRDSI